MIGTGAFTAPGLGIGARAQENPDASVSAQNVAAIRVFDDMEAKKLITRLTQH